MGCRLTRTESTELCEQTTTKEDEKQGTVSNGQAKAPRKDTPAYGGEPLREVESASQADFFRMLDAKIAHGADLDSENEA
ncbi:hypothetical protein OESDEN_02023 [Oesophagostomum dentatum]|uniref:Uncharacterized protein n=1 Tax=Oesophagostomum dentatum TaxID=61180 RepID=A0A0B1TQ84_OESDE|nr:hypothetical protein OESDEN_02023 [Oesophagostomum dentatum]